MVAEHESKGLPVSVKEFSAERLTERAPPDGAEHEVNEQPARGEVMLWMANAPPEDEEVQSVNERPSKVTENKEEDEDDA